MQLSLRLSAIADLVTEGNRLVDVGCDHGYLPVYLIQQKKIPSAIAMDVRKGPLSRAQEHIRQYGLEEYIQTRLSDGLEGLKAGEGDTLVIAGMGGPLMERILTDGRSVRNSFSELILQPQSDISHFRRFIQSEGWEITEAKMVEEDGKFYPMMRVVPGACLKPNVDSFTKNTSVKAASSEKLHADEWAEMPENPAAYTLEEAFGKYLLQERNPVLFRYLQRESRIRSQILEQLETAPKAEAVTARILEVNRTYTVIEKSGHPDETQSLFEELSRYDVMQFVRSGRVAITKSTVEHVSIFLQEQQYRQNQL